MAETLPYPIEIHEGVGQQDREDLLAIENPYFASRKVLRYWLERANTLFLVARGIPPAELPLVGPDDLWGPELAKPVNRIAMARAHTVGLLWCALGRTGGNRTRCEVKDVIGHVDMPEDPLLTAFLQRLKHLRHERDWAFLEANLGDNEDLTTVFTQQGFEPVSSIPQYDLVKFAWPARSWRRLSEDAN